MHPTIGADRSFMVSSVLSNYRRRMSSAIQMRPKSKSTLIGRFRMEPETINPRRRIPQGKSLSSTILRRPLRETGAVGPGLPVSWASNIRAPGDPSRATGPLNAALLPFLRSWRSVNGRHSDHRRTGRRTARPRRTTRLPDGNPSRPTVRAPDPGWSPPARVRRMGQEPSCMKRVRPGQHAVLRVAIHRQRVGGHTRP